MISQNLKLHRQKKVLFTLFTVCCGLYANQDFKSHLQKVWHSSYECSVPHADVIIRVQERELSILKAPQKLSKLYQLTQHSIKRLPSSRNPMQVKLQKHPQGARAYLYDQNKSYTVFVGLDEESHYFSISNAKGYKVTYPMNCAL